MAVQREVDLHIFFFNGVPRRRAPALYALKRSRSLVPSTHTQPKAHTCASRRPPQQKNGRRGLRTPPTRPGSVNAAALSPPAVVVHGPRRRSDLVGRRRRRRRRRRAGARSSSRR
jgi:hypothetical protein